MKRRVVVTGLGLVTPLGNTVDDTWSALIAGRSGVSYITKFDATEFPSKFAAEVRNFDFTNYISEKVFGDVGLCTQYAIAGCVEALVDSGLIIEGLFAERVGTCIASVVGDAALFEREHLNLLNRGPGAVSPFFISSLVNSPVTDVALRVGARGPCISIATGCTAGAQAIGYGFKLIQDGSLDAMVCGGSEAIITPLPIAGFSAMRLLSTRNDDPIRASRPFDRDRDGFVLGEGAGILVLEELEMAKSRGAHIYAEVLGYGTCADAYGIIEPDPSAEGMQRAMRLALMEPGIEGDLINYINAHGTSTLFNDKYETLAIKKLFGRKAYDISVSSTKSAIGHLQGAAGSVEAIFTILAIWHGQLPPTINYENPDPDCDLDYVSNKARSVKVQYALSNSFAFGGINSALLFGHYNE